MSLTARLLTFISVLVATPAVLAQPAPLTLKEAVASEVKVDGWHPELKLGANLSFGSSENVVGQTDGSSTTYGVKIDSGLLYKNGLSELQQDLNYTGATSKNPTIPRFVKSADEFEYKAVFTRGLETLPWVGPYALVHLKAPFFKGRDVRAEEATYALPGGSAVTTDSLLLTEGFKPLTTREAVGVFADWIKNEEMNLRTRLGYGAMQVEAGGQLAVQDDAATPAIEVILLRSFSQHGVEGGIDFNGRIDEQTTYSFTLDALYPIEPELPVGDTRDGLELVDFTATAKLSSRLYTWASVDFESRVIRQPLLIDRYQFQNNLILNFGHDFFGKEI